MIYIYTVQWADAWLENLGTILLQVITKQFEEKCHFLLPFGGVFVAKQAHVHKSIVDLFRRKKKKYILPTTYKSIFFHL